MGNQQSSESTRRKKIYETKPKRKENVWAFKGNFVRKEKYESFIRFYLDNYLVYKDGSYKHIDLANCLVFDDKSTECGLNY